MAAANSSLDTITIPPLEPEPPADTEPAISYAELIGRAKTVDLKKQIEGTTITYDLPPEEVDPWETEDPTTEWR